MWTSGYVSEVDYTHGFYDQLTPNIQNFCALIKGYHSPLLSSEYKYLELGFGQGLALNIHAATNPGSYWGNDFNPGHVSNAMDLATASEADLTALDDSFEELAARSDLPNFDVVCLHGVWTWISDSNREVIIDILRRKLKPGGLCYISYNSLPGWAPFIPVRELLVQFATRASLGTMSQKIDASLEFAQKVVDANSAYFQENPGNLKRLESMKDKDKNYLAHEYFNKDWKPMAFSNAAENLMEAKLTFAASAHLLDHIEDLNIPDAAREMLHSIEDPILRETTLDMFTNQQFRRDLFIKGPRQLSNSERQSRLQNLSFMMLVHPDDRPKTVQSSLGKAKLDDSIYSPICEVLSEDGFSPKPFAYLQSHSLCKHLSPSALLQALTILCGSRTCSPAHDTVTTQKVTYSSQRLNSALIRQSKTSSNAHYLAAPAIGSAISASRTEQLFLLAITGKEADIPRFVWQTIKSLGQKMMKDGAPVEDDDEALEMIHAQHKEFAEKRLPIFQSVGAV